MPTTNYGTTPLTGGLDTPVDVVLHKGAKVLGVHADGSGTLRLAHSHVQDGPTIPEQRKFYMSQGAFVDNGTHKLKYVGAVNQTGDMTTFVFEVEP